MVKNKIINNYLIYLITGLINAAVPFLFLPILTRFLSPSDYGIIANSQIFHSIVIVLVGLNTHGAIFRNFFNLSKQEIKIYISSSLLILTASFFLIFIGTFFFSYSLSSLTNIPEKWLYLIVISALFDFLSTLALTLWQGEEKPIPYGIFQIVRTATDIIFSLIFVVALKWEWQGRLTSFLITKVSLGLIAFIIIFQNKYVSFSVKKSYVKDALSFGVPLIPHSLSGWIMTAIDKIFITATIGVAATGIYSVGYQIGTIIGLLADSFNRVWVPFFYQKLNENNFSTKIKIVKYTYVYNLTIITLAVALSLIAPIFLKYFVGPTFQAAYQYVTWIALGYAAKGMYYMVVNYIFYVKKTHILAWVTFLAAFFNILLNYFTIKANGAIGAAQATTLTSYLTFILVWILSAKFYNMPWAFWRVRDESV